MKRPMTETPKKRENSAMSLAFSKVDGKAMPKRVTLILERRPIVTDGGLAAKPTARSDRATPL